MTRLLSHWRVDDAGVWSRVDSYPTRLDMRHLAHHARRAIFRRLKYAAPEALRAVERVSADEVVIRVNSGGNALEVQSYLDMRGYRAELGGANPDGYGSSVTVKLRKGTQK